MMDASSPRGKAPRPGELTLENAAICAVGLRALAERLAAHHDRLDEIGTCVLAAIWVERQLARVADDLFAGKQNTPVPVPPRELAEAIRRLGQDLSPLHDYGQLGEVCCLFAVAAADLTTPDSPLLELGEMALQRNDFQYAADCFDQLRAVEDADTRLNALYSGAQAHAALADSGKGDRLGHWTRAIDNLKDLEQVPPADLEHAMSSMTRSQLRALRNAIEERMRTEQQHDGPGRGRTWTGLQ